MYFTDPTSLLQSLDLTGPTYILQPLYLFTFSKSIVQSLHPFHSALLYILNIYFTAPVFFYSPYIYSTFRIFILQSLHIYFKVPTYIYLSNICLIVPAYIHFTVPMFWRVMESANAKEVIQDQESVISGYSRSKFFTST